MRIEIPYDKGTIEVEIERSRIASVLESNEVPVVDEKETLQKAIDNPVNSSKLPEFLSDAQDVLLIVNDATRSTPTSRVLEAIYPAIKTLNFKFIVATGAHRAPTEDEYRQIFGEFYKEFKPRISVHDARVDAEMVYLGQSGNGTEMYVNRLAAEAHKLVIISSVEPHYFAGYTGGRKSILPGVASYRTIEQNHKLAMSSKAEALVLDGNPVHEDMVDALEILRDKEIFTIMTVLDKEHRIYAATAGDINDAFIKATEKAKDVFAVKVEEKVDIVVTVARFPMDIDLYQSQKALENGKLALKDGGILILVSSCRCGVGDDTFIKLLCSCDTPEGVFKAIEDGYVLGYHKAAKMVETKMRADIYGVTYLPEDEVRKALITPFPTVQDALDQALNIKGKDAKVLFLLDGSVTVPVLE